MEVQTEWRDETADEIRSMQGTGILGRRIKDSKLGSSTEYERVREIMSGNGGR